MRSWSVKRDGIENPARSGPSLSFGPYRLHDLLPTATHYPKCRCGELNRLTAVHDFALLADMQFHNKLRSRPIFPILLLPQFERGE